MKNTNYIDISGPILDLCFTMAIGRNLVPLVLKKATSVQLVQANKMPLFRKCAAKNATMPPLSITGSVHKIIATNLCTSTVTCEKFI